MPRPDATKGALSSRPRAGASFAYALDAAIAARGLTLNGIRRELAGHGVEISTATLSYWRRDLRWPEGERSLRAVGLLERVLRLPAATLTSLVGPRRPRGRWVNRPETPAVAALAAELDDPGQGRCRIVSVQDVFTVRANGTERGTRSRLVLRGVRGQVTRHLVRYQSDEPSCTPELVATDFCRPGRVVIDPATGLLVAELLLDRPLTAGEHTVVEYEVRAAPGPTVTYYYRRLATPVVECSQLVRFEGTPPARCHSYWRDDLESPMTATGPLPLGPSRTSCFVEHGVPSGVVGTTWRW